MCHEALVACKELSNRTELVYNQTNNTLIVVNRKNQLAYHIYQETTANHLIKLGTVQRILTQHQNDAILKIIDKKNQHNALTGQDYQDLAEHMYLYFQTK